MLARNDAMTQPATAKPEFCVHMQLSHAGPGLVRSLHTRQQTKSTFTFNKRWGENLLLIAEPAAWPFKGGGGGTRQTCIPSYA